MYQDETCCRNQLCSEEMTGISNILKGQDHLFNQLPRTTSTLFSVLPRLSKLIGMDSPHVMANLVPSSPAASKDMDIDALWKVASMSQLATTPMLLMLLPEALFLLSSAFQSLRHSTILKEES